MNSKCQSIKKELKRKMNKKENSTPCLKVSELYRENENRKSQVGLCLWEKDHNGNLNSPSHSTDNVKQQTLRKRLI